MNSFSALCGWKSNLFCVDKERSRRSFATVILKFLQTVLFTNTTPEGLIRQAGESRTSVFISTAYDYDGQLNKLPLAVPSSSIGNVDGADAKLAKSLAYICNAGPCLGLQALTRKQRRRHIQCKSALPPNTCGSHFDRVYSGASWHTSNKK